MNFGAIPYIIPYLLLFFFWMLAVHRQINFWLYLWQLKEYHLGRFLAHFETAKGKSLFLNPLFAFKVALMVFAVAYFVWFGVTHSIPLAAPVLFTAWIPFVLASFWFSLTVTAVFALEAARAAWGIVKTSLLHPTITKKSLMLYVAAHGFIFAAALLVFWTFLGEMSQLDFAFAAFSLLAVDILLPLVIGVIVLALQPLTVWQKSKILEKAAAKMAARPDILTIGITGSYGKSVTKELVAHVFSKRFKVLKTEANLNTEMGVAQTVIDRLLPEYKVFVCEIGAVHKGRIRQVGGIVKPKIGILTGINQQHLGVFGSQQNIIDGKYEVLEVLPEDGTAILNWQSLLVRESFEAQKAKIKAKNVILCGKDVVAENVKSEISSLAFDIVFDGKRASVITNARGAFMVEPIMMAVSAALASGMDLEETATIINKTDFSPFNLKIAKNEAGIHVIDSSYSSNPDGVAGHLDYLKLWPGGAVSRDVPSAARGKKAIVMPCLIELGSESKKIHFEIGKKIAQVCGLAIITTKDRFGEIKKGAQSAGMDKDNIIFSDKPAEVAKLLKNRLSAGDVVLLEGRSARSIAETIK